jgi:hypothetical protein
MTPNRLLYLIIQQFALPNNRNVVQKQHVEKPRLRG